MKKTLDKVAIVAHICITFLFVLLTCLILFNGMQLEYDEQGKVVIDSVVVVILSVFAVVYLGLSAYLLVSAFTDKNLLREVLLYSDKGSLTKASTSVIKNIAKDNAKLVEGVKVKRLQVRPDDKLGFKLKVFVDVEGDEVALTLDTLRCALADSYNKVLGLQFSAIDFRVNRTKTAYTPDMKLAETKAKEMAETRTKEKSVLAENSIATETQNADVEQEDK